LSEPFSADDWLFLTNYLIENESINWQFWNYVDVLYGICDGPGYETNVTVKWNETLSTTYSHERDDMTCSGKRTYTVPEAVFFSNILLNKSKEIISHYDLNNPLVRIFLSPGFFPFVLFLGIGVVVVGLVCVGYRRYRKKKLILK
ncbi:MAG: hypothetical protein ACFFC7_30180, partial [Candidatus Hermodarchaeota archaeon]